MSDLEIRFVIFDVDGVFTDGKFFYSAEGKKYKQFGAHDSDGIKLLKKFGINVCAVSADHRGFKISDRRMSDMGLQLILKSEKERFDWIKENFPKAQTCYMGDGHFDGDIFDIVNFSIAPINAVERTRAKASYVTDAKGGEGAVYEAALKVLELNGVDL